MSGGFNFRFGSEGTELGGDFNRTGDDVSVLQPGFTMQVRTPIGMYFGMPMNVGVEGTIDLSGPATGLRIDLHPASPDGVRDTFIKQNDYASISPFVGFELGQIGNVGELYGMVGLRGTLKNVKGITDESAGGGEREEFSETKFLLGPMVGLELGIGGALANLGNFGNLGGYDDDGEDRVKLRFDLEYRPGTEVSGQSSLGFDYDFRTKGTVLGTLGITYEY